MRIYYYPDTDALYIALSETPSVESAEISENVVLNYGQAGRVVGIEIEHASENIDLKTLEAHSLPVAG